MAGKQISLGLLLVLFALGQHGTRVSGGFARTSGTRFVIDQRPFYSNGFNAYWLMYMAADPTGWVKVPEAFEQASSYGMNLVRTWAFRDGGYRPLQISPGVYNEDMFKGLDYVINEAKKNGVYLILSLVNNYNDFGGRNQYVQWARDKGQPMSSDDDFYTNEHVKSFYKNHITAVLSRNNTITGVAYKDEPAVFAWELMNEPRCQSDLSGKTLQDWIEEMTAHVKSVDSNHMVEVGLEGFYGESAPERKQFNPGNEIGTDYITNNLAPGVDFATIHAYPDGWIPSADEQGQMAFVQSWIQSHVDDAKVVLRKPLLVTEFGKSSRLSWYTMAGRDAFFSTVYNAIYASARLGGPFTGGLFWQLLADGMDNFRDGYEIVLSECPTTTTIISQQSSRISGLGNPLQLPTNNNKVASLEGFDTK